MAKQTKTNNWNYLIDPTFNKIVWLSYNLKMKTIAFSFPKYYTPNVEKKYLNVLIDWKSFLDLSVKNKEETYKNNIEMSKYNDYTTANLLDYEYCSKHFKVTAIDLSKHIELENTDSKQPMNFIGKLEEDEEQCFSSLKNQKEQRLNFYKTLWVSYKMETQKIINLLNNSSNEEFKFATKSGMS